MVGGLAMFLVFSLLPLAVVVAVVVAIVAAQRQTAEDAAGDLGLDAGIGSVRRLFIYTLALIGLIFAAVGVGMVIAGALDAVTGRVLIAERRQGLAVALAFSVVGAPAWLFFAWLAQRSVRDHPVEIRSQVRRLYLGLARGISVAVIAAEAITAGRMVAGVDPFRGAPWGALLAWGAVWFLHERLARAEPPTTVVTRLFDRFTAYFGALLGLMLMLGGAAGVLSAPLSEAYDRIFREGLVSADWTEALRSSTTVMLVGAALWGWHWLRDLVRSDRLTTLWRVQVFLSGALVGVVLSIVPAALVLYAVLEWFFGQPRSEMAVAHFADTPASCAVLAIGLVSWGYHRMVLGEAGDGRTRHGPERVYSYLLAVAGLATTATAVATFIALAADALGGPQVEFIRASGWWRNPAVRGITLLVVGAPLWLRHWLHVQRAASRDIGERHAGSRRIYVFATVGVAIVALLVSLTVLLYQVFRAMLGGDLELSLLRDTRWAIAVAMTAGAVATYHFLVLREDRAAYAREPAAAPPRQREVVIVTTELPPGVVAALERIPGMRLRAWRRVGAATRPLSEAQQSALVQAVSAETSDRLLVVVGDDSFEVVPFMLG